MGFGRGVRKARAIKTTAITGHSVSTGEKNKKAHTKPKEQVVSSRDREDRKVFSQRKGPAGEKHHGTAHTDPRQKLHQIDRSQQRLVTFCQNNKLQKPKLKDLRSLREYVTALESYVMRKRLTGGKPTLLKNFLSYFTYDGFQKFDPTEHLQDGEWVFEFVFDYLYPKFKTIDGGVLGSRSELKARCNQLNTLEFWSRFCKDCGTFLVPSGVREFGRLRTVVHHMPQSSLIAANSAFLKRKANTGSMYVEPERPTRIVGGSQRTYASVLKGSDSVLSSVINSKEFDDAFCGFAEPGKFDFSDSDCFDSLGTESDSEFYQIPDPIDSLGKAGGFVLRAISNDFARGSDSTVVRTYNGLPSVVKGVICKSVFQSIWYDLELTPREFFKNPNVMNAMWKSTKFMALLGYEWYRYKGCSWVCCVTHNPFGYWDPGDSYVVGGGAGRRHDGSSSGTDRTSRAKNGQGGKKKGNGKCGEGPNSQSTASTDSKGEKDPVKARKKKVIRTFISADKPNLRSLLDGDEEPEDLVDFDCFGAPFCGVTCVDTAAGIKPDPEKYAELVPDWENSIPEQMGTLEYLDAYTAHRSVNYKVFNEIDNLIYGKQHSRAYKWIYLKYVGQTDADDVGHFMIMVDPVGGEAVRPSEGFSFRFNVFELDKWLPDVKNVVGVAVGAVSTSEVLTSVLSSSNSVTGERLSSLINPITRKVSGGRKTLMVCAGVLLLLKLVSVEVYKQVDLVDVYNCENDNDTRDVICKRDKMESQEQYGSVQSIYRLRLAIDKFGFVHDLLDEHITQIRPRLRLCMLNRARVIMNDMETCDGDPMVNVKSIRALRGLNSRWSQGDLIDTRTVLEDYAEYLRQNKKSSGPPPNFRGLKQRSALGRNVYIPNMPVVVDNQLVGGSREGIRNHVKDAKWKFEEERNSVVAVAPIGTVVVPEGPIPAGVFNETDSRTVLAAFFTRAMSKENTSVKKEVDLCVKWGKELFDKLLEGETFSNNSVGNSFCERNIDAFRKAYKGKRSLSWINTRIEEYERFVGLSGHPFSEKEKRKYCGHGFFVKFESNMKVVNDMLVSRSRGIVQMSGLMLFECCQLISLLHQFYETKVERFQVKNLSISEMCERIEENSVGGCMVTDASAFESSLTQELREIENYVIKQLCKRSGSMDVWDKFRHHTTGYRDLVTKWGTFRLATRCSGDFWTSAGNGIMNISFAWYEHKRQGGRFEDFRILAEGDDGLVPKGKMTEEGMKFLGIKFSSETVGDRCGDVDFLKSLWQDGKRYLCIGESLKILWVKKAAHLKRGKQLYLLRMAALSLYHLSPGHPVLTALINRINRETRHVNWFRGYERYFDTWKGYALKESSFPENIQVDEEMRIRVAMGADGFPPISISTQKSLEEIFENSDSFNIGRMLDNDPDVQKKKKLLTGHFYTGSEYFDKAISECGIRVEGRGGLLPTSVSASLEF